MVLCTYTVQKYPINRKTPLSHTVTTPDVLELAIVHTAAIGGETTDIRTTDRSDARAVAMDGWSDARARARRDERQSDTRRRSRGSSFFLPPPRRVVARGDGGRSTPALPRIDPIETIATPRARFPASTRRGDGEGANAREDDDDDDDDDGPDRDDADRLARSVSDGDDDDVAAKRPSAPIARRARSRGIARGVMMIDRRRFPTTTRLAKTRDDA